MKKRTIVIIFVLLIIGASCFVLYKKNRPTSLGGQALSPIPSSVNTVSSSGSITLETNLTTYPVFTGDSGAIRATAVSFTIKNDSDHSVSFMTDSCTGAQLGVGLEKNISNTWNNAPEQSLEFCHTGPLLGCMTVPSGKDFVEEQEFSLIPDSKYRVSLKYANSCDPSGNFLLDEGSGLVTSNVFQTQAEPTWIQNFQGTYTTDSAIKTNKGLTYPIVPVTILTNVITGKKVTIKGYLVEDSSPNQYHLPQGYEQGIVVYPVSVSN